MLRIWHRTSKCQKCIVTKNQDGSILNLKICFQSITNHCSLQLSRDWCDSDVERICHVEKPTVTDVQDGGCHYLVFRKKAAAAHSLCDHFSSNWVSMLWFGLRKHMMLTSCTRPQFKLAAFAILKPIKNTSVMSLKWSITTVQYGGTTRLRCLTCSAYYARSSYIRQSCVVDMLLRKNAGLLLEKLKILMLKTMKV